MHFLKVLSTMFHLSSLLSHGKYIKKSYFGGRDEVKKKYNSWKWASSIKKIKQLEVRRELLINNIILFDNAGQECQWKFFMEYLKKTY